MDEKAEGMIGPSDVELKMRLSQVDRAKARIENWELRTRNMDRDSDRLVHTVLTEVLRIFDQEVNE